MLRGLYERHEIASRITRHTSASHHSVSLYGCYIDIVNSSIGDIAINHNFSHEVQRHHSVTRVAVRVTKT